MKVTRTYTRRGGGSFTLEVEIDEIKIADAMAEAMARTGRANAKRMDGAVSARIVAEVSVGAGLGERISADEGRARLDAYTTERPA